MRFSLICLVVVAVLTVVARADAQRDDAMIACVEGGGIYYEDGRCEGGTNATPTEPAPEAAEPAPDAAASEHDADADPEAAAKKACRKKGGRYGKDGTCEIRRDPVEQCKDSGGLFMSRGVCFRPRY